MPKVTKVAEKKRGTRIIHARTMDDAKKAMQATDWWNAGNSKDMATQMLATAMFIKKNNAYRYQQASMYAHLYGNMPLFGGAGTNLSRISMQSAMPTNRPTMSIVTSITDTIVSRMDMERPRPMFLTDGGDYRQRQLAKDLNGFIAGEFYQTGFYELRQILTRDACIFGTAVAKVLEDQKKRVSLERRLSTQILVDANESFMGKPRQLYEVSLMDRGMLTNMFGRKEQMLSKAEKAVVEQGGSETASDMVMVVEGWHLESGPLAGDGMHAIAVSSGHVNDEGYTKEDFPFLFHHYCPPMVGFWGQGVAARQMGNQCGINELLMQQHDSIRLVGVPRVFVEAGSKVAKAHLNNEVGTIVEYEGTKPSYEVANCYPAQLVESIQTIVDRAYQEEGVSQMAAQSVKPKGLDSGEAIREYDDVQEDRLTSLSRRDEKFCINAAYHIVRKARDIAIREGKYQTVYPDPKNGTQTINLPNTKQLDDPFVIQCFDVSSLPKDPSGRFQKITEWVQAGMYTPTEGRRLMGLPDTEQEDRLLNAAEERILQQLDGIVFDGKFSPPDDCTDLAQAMTIVTQYLNYYPTKKLEAERTKLLRKYKAQLIYLVKLAKPPIPTLGTQVPAGGGQPQAAPEPVPTNPMIPNVPGAAQ